MIVRKKNIKHDANYNNIIPRKITVKCFDLLIFI